jgi:hypothetical protein
MSCLEALSKPGAARETPCRVGNRLGTASAARGEVWATSHFRRLPPENPIELENRRQQCNLLFRNHLEYET